MAWSQRGARKGARRLPERLRKRVLAKWPQCVLAYPGRCTGKSEQVDHVIDAEDFDDPKDPRIDAEENLRGACRRCHEYKSAVNSQRRSVARQNEWKRKPEPHPGVLRDDEL